MDSSDAVAVLVGLFTGAAALCARWGAKRWPNVMSSQTIGGSYVALVLAVALLSSPLWT